MNKYKCPKCGFIYDDEKENILFTDLDDNYFCPFCLTPKKEFTLEEEKRVTILIKYKGYIDKTLRQVEKQRKMEEKQIPQDIDYEDVLNLSLEAKQKLSEIRPVTIAQASRISGINPADISVLLIYLKQHY